MQSATYGASDSTTMAVRRRTAGNGHWTALSAEELVAFCRMGDRIAFDELKRRYDRPVLGMAFNLVGNSTDAEDIAQEAFVRIFRAVGSIRNAVTLPAWIHCVVRTAFLDHIRARSRKSALSLETLLQGGGEKYLLAPELQSLSPHVCAEKRERRSIVQRAICDLPDHLREPVALYYCQERTYEEIAATMHIPVGTVKSRLNRGRHALRKLLDSESDRICLLAA